MDQERITWSAQEYAAALNRAATPTDLLELVREVNQKWGRELDGPRRVLDGDPLPEADVRTPAAS
jgi:hypothetical protein